MDGGWTLREYTKEKEGENEIMTKIADQKVKPLRQEKGQQEGRSTERLPGREREGKYRPALAAICQRPENHEAVAVGGDAHVVRRPSHVTPGRLTPLINSPHWC